MGSPAHAAPPSLALPGGRGPRRGCPGTQAGTHRPRPIRVTLPGAAEAGRVQSPPRSLSQRTWLIPVPGTPRGRRGARLRPQA